VFTDVLKVPAGAEASLQWSPVAPARAPARRAYATRSTPSRANSPTGRSISNSTDDVEGFLTGLHAKTRTATVGERQRVLRLLVKDVLIGPDKITIRHSMTGTATAARTAAR